MQNKTLFTRDDTFFGVCQGLGEDLGIHPNILRLAIAGLLFWSPYAAAAAYAVGGIIVLFTRLLVPVPKAAAVAEPVAEATEVEAEAEQVPLAA